MTNIPYVIRGTGKQREFLEPQKDYYAIPGSGLENLFMQLIVHGLKPGCRALVVVPVARNRRTAPTLQNAPLKTVDVLR
jgi:hypothetical protein